MEKIESWKVKEVKKRKQVLVLPNPINEISVISFDNQNRCQYEMRVYDILGNVLIRIENIVSDKVFLEKGDLTTGVYLIELKSGSQTLKGKILVE